MPQKAKNNKAIPELKANSAALSKKQDSFLEIQKTLEQLSDRSYYDKLKESAPVKPAAEVSSSINKPRAPKKS